MEIGILWRDSPFLLISLKTKNTGEFPLNFSLNSFNLIVQMFKKTSSRNFNLIFDIKFQSCVVNWTEN